MTSPAASVATERGVSLGVIAPSTEITTGSAALGVNVTSSGESSATTEYRNTVGSKGGVSAVLAPVTSSPVKATGSST